MGLLKGIFGVGKAVGGAPVKVATSVIGQVMEGLDALTTTSEEKGELGVRIAEIKARLSEAQTAINLADAGSASLFRGGWRPAVGWVCATALAWEFVARPIVVWVAGMFGYITPPPVIDTAALWPLLMGMLGLAGLRTGEKTRGLD